MIDSRMKETVLKSNAFIPFRYSKIRYVPLISSNRIFQPMLIDPVPFYFSS